MAIVQDKRTELSENFTCNTIDEVYNVLQEFIDNRVQFLKDSKLWLVVARASVIEGDIQYG
mgnify:CR=1 FL=1